MVHAEQIAALVFVLLIIFIPLILIIGVFRGMKAFVSGVGQGYENSWRREQLQKGFTEEQVEAMLRRKGERFSSFLLGNAGKFQILMLVIVAVVMPISIPFFIYLCVKQYRQWKLLQEELHPAAPLTRELVTVTLGESVEQGQKMFTISASNSRSVTSMFRCEDRDRSGRELYTRLPGPKRLVLKDAATDQETVLEEMS